MSSDDNLVEIFAELEINGNTSFVEEVAWRVLGKNEWFSLPPYLLPTRPAETTLQPLSIKVHITTIIQLDLVLDKVSDQWHVSVPTCHKNSDGL